MAAIITTTFNKPDIVKSIELVIVQIKEIKESVLEFSGDASYTINQSETCIDEKDLPSNLLELSTHLECLLDYRDGLLADLSSMSEEVRVRYTESSKRIKEYKQPMFKALDNVKSNADEALGGEPSEKVIKPVAQKAPKVIKPVAQKAPKVKKE